ncbi:MAG TPA: enoyl-CoA hydratase/isomerase family protein [Leptospiraceae bacterium]|nr:enoyl-CoA hydratase/isomerase family protein [Leptospiraceae bacterium]HNM03583.1 enoyl-CoA hydratase/isomerase family protein [Leptospiraceae bacterium]HNN03236.1 enoyl-CoA hydratase/isomerase family protein [Leptospiraceae bacterium]
MNYKIEEIRVSGGTANLINFQTNDQNSLTRANMKELGDILDEIKKNDQIKAVVFSSENPKFFCNGLDAETLLNTSREELPEAVGGIVLLFGRILQFDKPIITEVTGHAMGGGAVITTAGDYKYMLNSGCRIGFTEVMVGLPLPGMFVTRVMELVPPGKVREVCLEASTYKGKEAKEVGLIDETADDREGLRKLTMKKLETLLRLPMSGVRYTKQNINRKSLFEFEAHMKNSLDWMHISVVSENLLEAMRALKEKRRPNLK